LTSLAELRLTNSQDSQLTEDWENLLKEIKLEKLATKLLIGTNFRGCLKSVYSYFHLNEVHAKVAQLS
jgi:hypothetical protein